MVLGRDAIPRLRRLPEKTLREKRNDVSANGKREKEKFR
jgi:hypothetical protein